MTQAFEKLLFFIDGASQGNPGPSGIGVIVCNENGDILENISEYIGEGTNNTAEYTAFIYSLQEGLIRRADSVTINTDSEFLVKQLNGQYKVKDEKIKLLFNQAQRLLKGFKEVKVNHINRSKNKGADKLATASIASAIKRLKPQDKQVKFLFENNK